VQAEASPVSKPRTITLTEDEKKLLLRGLMHVGEFVEECDSAAFLSLCRKMATLGIDIDGIPALSAPVALDIDTLKGAAARITDGRFELHEGYTGRFIYGRKYAFAFTTPFAPASDQGKRLLALGFTIDHMGTEFVYYLFRSPGNIAVPRASCRACGGDGRRWDAAQGRFIDLPCPVCKGTGHAPDQGGR